MKRLFKHISRQTISLALTLLMVAGFFVVAPFGSITANAETEGDWEYAIIGGYAYIRKYTGNDVDVVIPDTLGNYSVIGLAGVENTNYYQSIFYSKRDKIRSVTIPDSIQRIGNNAFAEMPNLTCEINISRNVNFIGDSAFRYSSVKRFNVDPDNNYFCSPDGNLYDKSQTKLIQYALGSSNESYCLPSSVTETALNAFSFKDQLTSFLEEITVESGNTTFSAENGVLYDYGKTNLISYPAGKKDYCFTIPNTVTDISEAACRSCIFSSVVIPSGVTLFQFSPFLECKNLKKAIFLSSSRNISFVYFEPYHAFSNCNAELKIYGFSGTSASSFASRYNIPFVAITDYKNDWLYNRNSGAIVGYNGGGGDVNIPATVNGRTVTSIAADAFFDMDNIASMSIPNTVSSINSTFRNGCTALTSITVDADNNNFSSSDGILYDKAQTTLLSYPPAKSDSVFYVPSGVTDISAYAFYSCELLEDVRLPADVASIGNNAFQNCGSTLKDITILNQDLIFGNADVFDGVVSVNLHGDADSTAESYASGKSNVNFVLLTSTSTTNINFYIDMHSETEPVRLNTEEYDLTAGLPATTIYTSAFTQEGTSTVYSATVPVNFTVDTEDTYRGPKYPVKVLINLGDNYDYEVDLDLEGFRAAERSGEIWIDKDGSEGEVLSYDIKTQVNDLIGNKTTKRVYFTIDADKSTPNDQQRWALAGAPKIHYWGGSDSTTWDTRKTMEYTGTFDYENRRQKVYFYNIPADTTGIIFTRNIGNDNHDKTMEVTDSDIVDGRRYYLTDQVPQGTDDWSRWYVGWNSALDNTPFISQYYDDIVLSEGDTTSYAVVTGYQTTATLESSNTSVVTVDNDDLTLTGVAEGTATVTIKAWGYIAGNLYDDQHNNFYDKTIKVTVRNHKKVGGFAVMSFDSSESTISAQNADAFSLTTSVDYGGGEDYTNSAIVTSTGSGGSTVYTVKYAKPDADLGYDNIAVTANVTASCGSDRVFDKWTKPAGDTNTYNTANASLILKNGSYVLKYVYHYDIV